MVIPQKSCRDRLPLYALKGPPHTRREHSAATPQDDDLSLIPALKGRHTPRDVSPFQGWIAGGISDPGRRCPASPLRSALG